ncbi:MAG: serine/threonine-protein kinase, partial [Planctomycetota bacterium]
LKPSNILVGDEGARVSVLDFGLAKGTTETELSELSLTGQILGTPAYMSPEQASGDLAGTDTRTDVFSLGAILFQVLTGTLPHQRSSSGLSSTAPLQVLRSIAEEDAPLVRTLRRDVPQDVEAIVSKALARDPDERYSTASDLADDVERFLAGRPVIARSPSTFDLTKRWLRRNWLAATAAFALGVLGAITLFLYTVSLEVERERADRWAYGYGIQLASIHLEDNQPGPALHLLESAPEEFRSWEWDWLRRRVDSSDFDLGPFPESIQSLEFSADGRWLVLATGGEPPSTPKVPELVVVDVARREIARRIRDAKSSLYAVAVTNDSKRVYSGGKDGVLRIHDIESGSQLSQENVGWAFDVDVSRDGKWVAWATYPEGLFLRHEMTGEVTRFAGEGGQDDSIEFTPGGRFLAWGYRTWRDGAGYLVLVDVENRREVARRKLSSGVYRIAVNPDASIFAFSSFGGVGRWRAQSDTLDVLPFGEAWVYPEFDDQGRLYAADQASTVAMWSSEDLRESKELRPMNRDPVLRFHGGDVNAKHLATSREGEWVAAGQRSLKVWRTKQVPGMERIAYHGSVRKIGSITPYVRIDPTQKKVLHIGDDNRLVVQDLKSLRDEFVAQPSEYGFLRDADWFPDGRIVSVWTKKFDLLDPPLSTLLIHDPRSGDAPQVRPLGKWRIWGMKVAPDGSTIGLFHAGQPGTVEEPSALVVLDGVLFEERHVFEVFRYRVQRAPKVRYSRDGKIVAMTNSCGFGVWNVETGARLHFRQEERDGLSRAVLLHPNGHEILIAVRNEVLLYRLNDLEEVRRLAIHSRGVNDIALSPQGDRLLTASTDGSVRIWDFETGRALVALEAGAEVTSVEMTRDGRTILAHSRDQGVRRWSLSP